MSCWVVPSVAAELWGCTIDAVMSKIQNGHVATRDEAGWTFVDVAPDSPTMESPKASMKLAQPADVVSRDQHFPFPDFRRFLIHPTLLS